MARQFALPARTADIREQRVGDDVVVLHPGTGRAIALSGFIADVWHASASGVWTGPVDDNLHAALGRLTDAGLLVPATGLTRRRLLQGVGAATVIGGLASVALPAADAAASTHAIDFGTGAALLANQPAGSHTLTVPASATDTIINFTLVGAGGGGAGAAGGAGGVVSGMFTVPASGSPTTFTVITASGGLAGNNGGTGGSGWVSGTGFAKDAGDGGAGHGSTPANAGGGGGSSAFYVTGGAADPLAVAGGGGGGGGNAGGTGGAGNGGTNTGSGADSGGNGGATIGTAATGGTTTAPVSPRGIASAVESGGARGTGAGGSLGTNRVGGVGGTGGDGDAQGSSSGGGGGGGGAAGGGGGMGGQKNTTSQSQGGGGGSGYDNGTATYALTGLAVAQSGASPAGIGGTNSTTNGTGGYASFTSAANISGSTP